MKTNTKRLFSVLIAAIMLLTLLPLTASAAEFDGGNGSAENPYLISTKAQMEKFRDMVNGRQKSICAKLMADIDLQGSENNRWTPIGIYNDDGYIPYHGVFDGNGHIITGLYVNNPNNEYQGLFGYLSGATVKNVGVYGTVKGDAYIGGIVGCAFRSTIQSCFFSGTVEGEVNMTGGIGGTVVFNCIISDCWFVGSVKAAGTVGGIIGDNFDGSTVSNCYSIGTVIGNEKVGDIVGNNDPDVGGTVTNCYYLSGTATTGIGNGNGEATAKTKAEFENGTVLKLLIDNRTDHPWGYECRSVSGSSIAKQPVLNWQIPKITQDSDLKTGEMTVTHSEEVSYIVTVPEKVTAEQDFNITLSQVNPEPDCEVRVTLSGLTDNKLVLSRKGDENTKLTASVYKSSDMSKPLANGEVIISADEQYLGENKLVETLSVSKPQADSGTVKAGIYDGTVTFTVEYGKSG